MFIQNEVVNEELDIIFSRTRHQIKEQLNRNAVNNQSPQLNSNLEGFGQEKNTQNNDQTKADQNEKVNNLQKKLNNIQKAQSTTLNRKLNAIIQSEKVDFKREEDTEILLGAINNQQKSLYEAKLAVMAFQQLDFFAKKQIFQVNDSMTEIINASIKVHSFSKYSCIQEHGQQSNFIYIILRGQAAVLRVEPTKKRHSISLLSIKEKSKKQLETQNLIKHKQDLNISLTQTHENQHKNEQEIFKSSLHSIDEQHHSHSHQNMSDKEKFIEYRIQHELIKYFQNLNKDIIKKNYSNGQAKKEALAKYMSKTDLIQTFKQKVESIKESDNIYQQLNSQDKDHIQLNYPHHHLTYILNVGDYFCEESLIYKTHSNGNIISLDDDCLVISLSRDGFENIVKSYYLKIVSSRLNFLKQYKFFDCIAERDILNIIPEIKELSLGKNSLLFKEGDPTDEIFFLYSGQLELQKNYSVQELNQIIVDYKNELRGKFAENNNKFYIDISNNVNQKRKHINPVDKIIQNCQGISVKRTNKDKTNLNLLSIARDNFRNMRLVTLYQYTPGSFCGDKELFEEITVRQNRVVVVSHQAIILSITAQLLLNVLKLNKTYDMMVAESQKKDEFYMQRTIDYILLNQNFNKKKSLGTSELMEIINQRKKINIKMKEEEEKQEEQIQQEENKADLKIYEVKQKKLETKNKTKQAHKNQVEEENLDQLQLNQKENIHSEYAQQQQNKADYKEIFDKDDFEGMDNLNKSLVKRMNILKQGDSIFDSTMPKHMKEIIIKKIKQLRHLTPASVKGVIAKVLNEDKKIRSVSIQNKNQQNNQQQSHSPKHQKNYQRPKTVLINSSQETEQSFTEFNENLHQQIQKSARKNYQDQNLSKSLILISKQDHGLFSLEKQQTDQDELIKQLANNPIKQIFKSYQKGKKNFKQIFLQSIENKQQRRDSIQMLKKGIKIEAIMREKREKEFQEYMNEELEDKRIKVLKRKPEENKLQSNENQKNQIEDQKVYRKDQNKLELNRQNIKINRNFSANYIQKGNILNENKSFTQERSISPTAALSKFSSARFQAIQAAQSNNFVGTILSQEGNLAKQNILQGQIQGIQNNKDKTSIRESILSHFTEKNTQGSFQSFPETQFMTERNDTEYQLQDIKRFNSEQAKSQISQFCQTTQYNEQSNLKNDDILVKDFLTERDIPQTKKQIQLANAQMSQKNTQSSLKDFIQHQTSSRKLAQFSQMKKMNNNYRKLHDQSIDAIKEDYFVNQTPNNKCQHPNLLITLGDYEENKLIFNKVEQKNINQLDKIKQLIQQNKKLNLNNSNTNNQNRFQSSATGFKKDASNNQTNNYKNRSFIVTDFQPNNNSVYGLTSSKGHRKLLQTTSLCKDKLQNNINEVLSPKTNPITYSTLSTKITSRLAQNNTPKETNIHKINLEKSKQRQINIPISMGIRRKCLSQNQCEFSSAY
ncbi:hypothetical protein TTHERM_00075720 (macronuclear) [Tetrahymena thermophila SB210]|uniref:Cyclic nucleotide-binding domain-containing protein n=1 Tax=Tetrahymena thermophila (strain SB210) TaxID=312017 RepID=Q23G93_TETTS|nr:hypothetical protein TTHERM_00075720 [Tetrahymena thermophila SB210]EAR95367.2 hypothetical protein TTHERM_00075720 [Tetrahymena thermophila SB210]|eukprot:XP_001015612.2 hypothetical protein TTHERM_00075720 [Tetrahymena thermophila SB210]